ncbi:hypothetical protein Lser_V15G30323 [Lactuca serriola]
MEEGDSERMDRKGKRKIEHIIFLDKGESSMKNNSQRNRNIVHEGRRHSSSSLQENESAPVANARNVSISTETAAVTTIRRFNDGRRRRPIQFRNRSPRTFSNSSTTTALGGQKTHVVAEGGVLPPPQPKKGTTSSSRNQRKFEPNYLRKNCSRPFSNVCVLLRHEPNFDIDVGIQSRSRTATPPTQNNNFSARLTSPQLGFDSSHASGIPRPIQFKSYTRELNEIGFEDIAGRNTRRRRLNTNLSLSNSELINDDGSVDLLSLVGRNTVENHAHDHDRDLNNEESDELIDLLSRVGLNPSG